MEKVKNKGGSGSKKEKGAAEPAESRRGATPRGRRSKRRRPGRIPGKASPSRGAKKRKARNMREKMTSRAKKDLEEAERGRRGGGVGSPSALRRGAEVRRGSRRCGKTKTRKIGVAVRWNKTSEGKRNLKGRETHTKGGPQHKKKTGD